MKFNLKTLAQFGISLLLAGILIYYISTQIDFNKLLKGFEKVDYTWVWISMLISMVAHISRGLRWNILLKPLGYQIKPANAAFAVLTGYLANYVFPRAGELARCSYVHKTDKLPINIGLGTVITERLVDLVALLIVTLLCFVVEFNKLNSFFLFLWNEKWKHLNQSLQNNYWLLIVAVTLFAACIVAIYLFRNKLAQVSFISKITAFIKGLLSGIMSITKLQNAWLFIGYTIVIWVAYYFMAYVIFFSMPETATLPPQAGLVVLALASFGMAAPVQGGIGVYHIMVAMALSIYGISQTTGYVLATVFHTSQFVCILATGALSTLLLLFIKSTNHDGQ